jgi:transposase-like protein
MSDLPITERQQFWLDHIQSAEAFDGSVADYARAHELTPQELYQWKTILTRRGLLSGRKRVSDFVGADTPTTQFIRPSLNSGLPSSSV